MAFVAIANSDPDIQENYYWDAPLEEDYDWRDHFPSVDCMEICFDIANSEKKITWVGMIPFK